MTASVTAFRERLDRNRARDYPQKCAICRRWMRMRPRPGDGYVTRRGPTNADRCTECPLRVVQRGRR